MLGFSESIPWHMDECEGLVIDLPESLQAAHARPCKQAWSFRIKGEVSRIAAAPVLFPVQNWFVSPLRVTLAPSEPGSEIRYTMDGTDPVRTSSLYAGPLHIPLGKVLKARAFRPAICSVPGSLTAWLFWVIRYTPGFTMARQM